jgi:DNA (cytosine-5)-methyltransferase 1
MNGPVAKRLITISQANIQHGHLYLTGMSDFFPRECLGPPSRRSGSAQKVQIDVDGFDEPVYTDIPVDAKTGRSRRFFRERAWVRRFFRLHGLRPGDLVAIERIRDRRYAIRPERPASTFRAAEFFAGIGLVRLALERQGWTVVYANDIDEAKAEMYRHNWPKDDHLVVADIHRLNADDIPECDLFTASFPCNDLSIAGRWEGLNGKHSSAFWGFLRIVRDLDQRRPRLILLENVVGFLMSHGGRDFEQAMLALNDLGYVVDAIILNARHWTPQSRPRLFVIARRDQHRSRQSLAVESDSRPDALVRFIYLHQNIKWDIRQLPRLPTPRVRLVDILEKLPPNDPHWWDAQRARYFMNQLSERHEAEARRMLAGRSYSYATAFRRVRHGKSMAELRTDGLAGCLRTPRGGSGRQILLKAGRGKYRVRLLSARECARLQGTPDTYRIDVGLNQALFGFGDAVCVPAVEWVAKHYLTQLMYASNSCPSRIAHG